MEFQFENETNVRKYNKCIFLRPTTIAYFKFYPFFFTKRTINILKPKIGPRLISIYVMDVLNNFFTLLLLNKFEN